MTVNELSKDDRLELIASVAIAVEIACRLFEIDEARAIVIICDSHQDPPLVGCSLPRCRQEVVAILKNAIKHFEGLDPERN